jgi:hypothetical protein
MLAVHQKIALETGFSFKKQRISYRSPARVSARFAQNCDPRHAFGGGSGK